MIIKTQISSSLSKIKLLAMDVDGTLTDSAMYYSEHGEAMKRFSTRDGMGITLLHKSQIQTAIITSENSPIVTSRANKLGINFVVLGCRDKTSAIKDICKHNNLDLSEIAFIGDDVNDEHILKLVGFSACPSDAIELIKSISDYICSEKGGHGAVRELAEMILISQNKPISIQEQW